MVLTDGQIRVQLGVVGLNHGGIGRIGSCDGVGCIPIGNDVNGGTVRAGFRSETDGLVDLKVGTAVVDGVLVAVCELVAVYEKIRY